MKQFSTPSPKLLNFKRPKTAHIQIPPLDKKPDPNYKEDLGEIFPFHKRKGLILKDSKIFFRIQNFEPFTIYKFSKRNITFRV